MPSPWRLPHHSTVVLYFSVKLVTQVVPVAWNEFRDIREAAFPDEDYDCDPEYDLNKDGKVDIQDITLLVNIVMKKKLTSK